MKAYSDIDSKFRFVILASKRAKQLLAGSKPKLESKSKNLIRIAQEEVKNGLVEYEIVQAKKEGLPHSEEVFIGEELNEEMFGEQAAQEAETTLDKEKDPEKKSVEPKKKSTKPKKKSTALKKKSTEPKKKSTAPKKDKIPKEAKKKD